MAQVGIFAHPVTGNVGVGTTTPRRRLDVQGGDVIVSGNVGVGTTNPTQALHVVGNIFSTGTLTASNVSVIGDFVTLNTVTSNTEQMVITNSGTGPGLKVTQTGAEAIAEFYDDGGVLAMKVADGGNVGIGTVNPLYRMDIRNTLLVASNNAFASATYPYESAAQASSARSNMGFVQTPWLYTSVVESPPQKGTGTTLIAVGDAGGYLTSLAGNVGTGVNNISMVTSGYDRLRIGSTGNVGIGTVAPMATLHVRPNSSTVGVIIDQVGTGDILDIRDAGVSKVVVDAQGNVGIGAVTPQARLDVNGNILLPNNSALKARKNDNVIRDLLSIDSGNTVRIYGPGNTLYINPDSASTIEINYNTSYETRFWYGVSQKMVINNTGVGIGTTNPQSRVHVNGSIYSSDRPLITWWTYWVQVTVNTNTAVDMSLVPYGADASASPARFYCMPVNITIYGCVVMGDNDPTPSTVEVTVFEGAYATQRLQGTTSTLPSTPDSSVRLWFTTPYSFPENTTISVRTRQPQATASAAKEITVQLFGGQY